MFVHSSLDKGDRCKDGQDPGYTSHVTIDRVRKGAHRMDFPLHPTLSAGSVSLRPYPPNYVATGTDAPLGMEKSCPNLTIAKRDHGFPPIVFLFSRMKTTVTCPCLNLWVNGEHEHEHLTIVGGRSQCRLLTLRCKAVQVALRIW